VCGDGACNGGETTCTCALDCGALCGDGCCNGGEDAVSCLQDCATCGDGVIEGAEDCDDGNPAPGDGCSASCQVEAGYTCAGAPSCCARCGNGVADCGEPCDGADLRGESCLSQGLLPGGGEGLACVGCALSTAGCTGGAIDSQAALEAALALAWAQDGHEAIGLAAGPIALSGACLVLDECGGVACTGGKPFGVTLAPLGAEAVLDASACELAVHVRTGKNVLRGLRIEEPLRAILLDAADAVGQNELDGLMLRSQVRVPGVMLQVSSPGNRLTRSALLNQGAQPGEAALSVTGQGTRLVGNLFAGAFARGVNMESMTLAGTLNVFDHNTVRLLGTSGTALRMNTVRNLCYRNNLVAGNGGSIGYDLKGVVLSLACEGSGTAYNANAGHLTACTGNSCNSACTNGGPMCDLVALPDFADPEAWEACLGAGSGLIDGAVDLGYDQWDGDPARFRGAGPDVGAREDGTTRSYGGIPSTCP